MGHTLQRWAEWPDRFREAKEDRRDRHMRTVRPTRDLRLFPAGLVAWATALLTGGGEVSLPPPAPWLVAAAATVVLVTLGLHRSRWRAAVPGVVLCVLIAVAVAATAWSQNAAAREIHEDVFGTSAGHRSVRLQVEILDRPVAWNATDRYGGDRNGEGNSGVVLRIGTGDGVEGSLFATDTRWRTVRTGDLAEVVASAAVPDAAEWTLRTDGPPRVVARAERGPLPGWLERAKSRFAATALPHGSDTASLMPGMTFGDRSGFDPALEQAMKDTGLTHLTAVSGSNCALVMLLAGHTALTLGATRRACLLSGLAALVIFVLLVGPDPSVLRAAVMGSVAAAGVFVGRGGTSLAALSAAMCLLLVVDPGLGSDFGFALSVCATAGIVITGRPLIRVLDRWLPTVVSTLIAVPVVAQLWCAAVLTLLTPTVAVWSVPANAVVAPIVPAVTVLGLVALLALGIGGTVGTAVGTLLMTPGAWSTSVVGAVARFFAGLPGAVAPWWQPPVGPAVMAVLCVAVVLTIHRLDRRAAETARNGAVVVGDPPGPVEDEAWLRGRRRQLRWRLLSVGVVLVCVLSLIGMALVRPGTRTDWHAVVCDVGQGDAVLLRGEHDGRDTTVLIDTGPDPASLRACLRGAHVETLDLLVLTHDHADHVAGAAGLAEEIEIRKVWWSSGTGRPPHEILGWTVPSERPPVGTKLVGPGLDLEVLGPVSSPTPSVDSAGENNASLAVRARVNGQSGFTYFGAGDMEEEAARRLIRTYGSAGAQPPGAEEQRGGAPAALGVDVLKVSHHGARNGGTALIDATSPTLAVVSVGADNDYGHPHPEITGHLARAEIPLARTDQLGSFGLFPEDGRLTVEPLR